MNLGRDLKINFFKADSSTWYILVENECCWSVVRRFFTKSYYATLPSLFIIE